MVLALADMNRHFGRMCQIFWPNDISNNNLDKKRGGRSIAQEMARTPPEDGRHQATGSQEQLNGLGAER